MIQFPEPPKKQVVLPTPLPYRPSPNSSVRSPGIVPYLIVVHRPVGSYFPSINWLTNKESQASAHVITEGRNTGVDVATQLVRWHRKAWACASFNSASYNIEVDDDAWDGDDWGALFTAARICAFICHKTGIRPAFTSNPLIQDGLATHKQLGKAGGGHADPTDDATLLRYFERQVQREFNKGGFRNTWGRGTFAKVSV